jgi:hypothetical protein
VQQVLNPRPHPLASTHSYEERSLTIFKHVSTNATMKGQ